MSFSHGRLLMNRRVPITRIVVATLCASLSLLGSCAPGSIGRDFAAVQGHCVFIVTTPVAAGTGFWITPSIAVTSAHVFPAVDDGGFVVAYKEFDSDEGFELGVVSGGEDMEVHSKDDWAFLVCRSGACGPDDCLPVVTMEYPEIGAQAVVIGVFEQDFQEERPSPRQFRSFVHSPPAEHPKSGESSLVWLDWPVGLPAHGFSGGPAFIIDKNGDASLFGIVIEMEYSELDLSTQYLLVRRLTPELFEHAQSLVESP